MPNRTCSCGCEGLAEVFASFSSFFWGSSSAVEESLACEVKAEVPSQLAEPSSPARSRTLVAEYASGGSSTYGFALDKGPRARMEDMVLICPGETEILSVLDGHGDQSAVLFLSEHLPPRLQDISCQTPLDEAVAEVFAAVDKELLERYKKSGQGERKEGLSAGCVSCTAFIREGLVTLCSLGDCRAVWCRGGVAVPATRDHHPAEPEELRRLQDCGVEVTSDGYVLGLVAVTRAFGDLHWSSMAKCPGLVNVPEVSHHSVYEDDEFLIIGCDGIYEKLSNQEVARVVRRALQNDPDPEKAALQLISAAKAAGGTDNLSCIVRVFNVSKKEELPARSAPRLKLLPKRTGGTPATSSCDGPSA